jgi:hypothetical protein
MKKKVNKRQKNKLNKLPIFWWSVGGLVTIALLVTAAIVFPINFETSSSISSAKQETNSSSTVLAAPVVSLVGIEVDKLPNKLNYSAAETVETSGGILRLVFSDYSVRYVPMNNNMIDTTRLNTSTLGTSRVTLSYSFNQDTLFTSYNINIVPFTLAATKLSLNITTSDILLNQVVNLNYIVEPSNASYSSVVWSSSNELLASVDSNGQVSAKNIGEVVITATLDGNLTASARLRVIAVATTEVGLNTSGGSSGPILEFEDQTIDAAENDEATFGLIATSATSSNNAIATVALIAGNVVITSIAAGSVTITLVDEFDNQATMSIIVEEDGSITIGTIVKYVPVVFAESTNNSIANNVGKLGLVGTSASSSNNAVATASIVNENISITSVGAGSATITVSVNSNQATIAATVANDGSITIGTITKYVAPVFTVSTNVATSNNEATLGLVGTSASSSATGIVSVEIDVNDKIAITSVAVGSATITVTDGTNEATIAVTVAADGSITIGTITKYVFPSQTNNSSSNDLSTLGLVGNSVSTTNNAVATATISGGKIVITSVGVGSANIVVSDVNSNQATIAVSVANNGAITIGTITKYVFPTQTDSTTINNEATLGLVGTTITSSNSGVATATITGGNIVITSVGIGSATITVSVGSNQATIAVTVAIDGSITIGTITKYAFPTSTFNCCSNNVNNLGLIGNLVTSSNEAVITAAIVGNQISITTVSAGTATVTVSDGNPDSFATIAYTVNANGGITQAITKADRQAPNILFSVDDGDTGVSSSYVNILIYPIDPTKDPNDFITESIRNIDGTAFAPIITVNGLQKVDVSYLITFKENDASGVDVPFVAYYVISTRSIEFETNNLKKSQVYYLALAPVEDLSGNETALAFITFTTEA